MPIPFLLVGVAAVAGIAGIAKGTKAVANNSEAKRIIAEAQYLYNNSKDNLEIQRAKATDSLEYLGELKLEAWSVEMNMFINTFKSFKNVQLKENVDLNERLKVKIQNPENLKNMEIATIKANEVVEGGIASLGAGALAGIASYGGAIMFASASTGTAIATLSGAAATNATLAWFGGGALSAGGLGMVGGTAVLGGIVVGPVLAVAGFIMEAKSEENLAMARKTHAEAADAAEKMDTMADFMSSISNIADEYAEFIADFREKFIPLLEELQKIKQCAEQRQKRGLLTRIISRREKKIDFAVLSLKEQKTLHVAWLMAQIFYSVLAAPLLTQKGDLDKGVYNALEDAKQSLPAIEQAQQELEQLPNIQNDNLREYTNVKLRGNALGWRILNFFMGIHNWICTIVYVGIGIGIIEKLLIVGTIFLIMGIIICPLIRTKKKVVFRKKFVNKVMRYSVTVAVFSISMSLLI